MTQPVATNLRNTLERNHAEVVAMLIDGATQPQVAQHFGVARSTVLRFVERNQDEIDAKAQRIDYIGSRPAKAVDSMRPSQAGALPLRHL